jgi:LmbE family N-acetylglucosaminyl deacetylase
MIVSKLTIPAVSISTVLFVSLCVFAQVRPVYDYGALGLGQLLKRLNNTKSVMHIGAHPDDEDSGLLAYLARGENARTAYLSLTRGEGGQNIIGTELSEALGVIRTEELLQARRLDGAEQYFTRAIDYGFSKTLAEAKEKWDEEVILCDMVRAIRQFRPLVVISRFSGTPADGHGQHQFAGYITPIAIRAAADANQCREAGHPWQVLKFYVGQGFRDTKEPTLRINTGKYDYLLGRSYFEIAMEGRSQHKTQEQGVLELKGERFSGLNLVESKVQRVEKETSVFDGIDTKITDIPKLNNLPTEVFSGQIAVAQKAAERALQNYTPDNPREILPVLIEGLKAISETSASLFKYSALANSAETKDVSGTLLFLEQKRLEFLEAVKFASGLQLDTLANSETIAPGENFFASVKVFYPDSEKIKVKEIVLQTPKDWKVSKTEEPKETNQNPFRREVAKQSAFFDVKVPEDENLTQPYFIENERNGYLYRLNADVNPTVPFQKPPVSANVTVEIDGKDITFSQPLEYRFADDIRGEIRRSLNVVPKLSVSPGQKLLIIAQSERAQTRRIVLSIMNNSSKPVSGTAELKIVGVRETDWKISAAKPTFNLKTKDEKTTVSFDLTIPAKTKAGEYRIAAQVSADNNLFTNEMNTIAYPHIQTHRYYVRAETKVVVTDLKTAPVKVGYIAGSGDRVFDAIRHMNFDVEMIDENYLTNGDLSRFDTIVVGIRASQVRPDFIANHQRLLDYVKNGGTLLVQYQLPVYQSLLPFPAQINARVTDENAKVTILEPMHPVFTFPNKITDKDFENWVQERNLYALTNFDAAYKPLLESHDAGEAENKGGLVVADIGKGKYIYCSYAFFRQLPAGKAGAYRLFANLLSVGWK